MVVLERELIMSDPSTIEIKGFEELLKALREAPEKVMPYLSKAMHLSVRAVQARVAEDTPSSAANQPGRVDEEGKPMGYYERGRGWWYPVLQSRTLGSEIGVAFGAETAKRAAKRHKVKSIPTVAGYKLAGGGLSERLGAKWDTQVIEQDEGILGVIGNNVSYADYVQGARQSKLHEARGWQTVQKALDASMDEIYEFFGDAVDEYTKNELSE